jgi:catechol 2,3-dioxygenase-like lactoylglutathione lyase family enzyme
MIIGMHALIYTRDAAADRAFFRHVLGFPHVDAHDGWLIFALPPAELGVHPVDGEGFHELHLMCDDVAATVKALARKGAKIKGPVKDMGYGLTTTIRLPGGGEIGLYEPRHLSPLDLPALRKRRPAYPRPAKKPAKRQATAKPRASRRPKAKRR